VEVLRRRLAELEGPRPSPVSRAYAEDKKSPLWQCVGCREAVIGMPGEDGYPATRDAHAKRCNARDPHDDAFDLTALWVTS